MMERRVQEVFAERGISQDIKRFQAVKPAPYFHFPLFGTHCQHVGLTSRVESPSLIFIVRHLIKSSEVTLKI